MNNVEHPSAPKIVIIGGGFGGIAAARQISKKFPKAHIILISNKRYFEYYPGLYRIVTGTSPIEVCVPLVDMVPKKVECLNDTVTEVNLKDKKIIGSDGIHYSFDYLVIALGSETTYFDLPGLDNLSLGFKSINEALRLKDHITTLFEEHMHPSQSELVSHFHIVIVGGGPSGIEVAGDLSAHMQRLARVYSVDPSFITIDLIEAGGRVLPTLPPKVSERVLKQLRTLGINIFLNRRMVKEDIETVYLKDMSLQSKTVIWTAGTRTNSLLSSIHGLQFSDKKRVVVDQYLRIPGYDDSYVIGDAAQTPYSGLAQTAIYDGAFVAQDIVKRIRGIAPKTYKPKKVAFSIPVGESWGVFSSETITFYGRLAYEIRQLIDFMYFLPILKLGKLFSLFFEGWKYRKAQSKKH